MYLQQMFASLVLSAALIVLILRLVQKGSLDIAYCWIWLGIGLGMVSVVLRYDLLERLSALIGARTPTTTLFLLGILVILLLCLQFSLVISAHRRKLKALTQELALLRSNQQK